MVQGTATVQCTEEDTENRQFFDVKFKLSELTRRDSAHSTLIFERNDLASGPTLSLSARLTLDVFA